MSQWTSNNKFRNMSSMQQHWIQDRLRQLGKTQRGLATHMGLDPSRVTELLHKSRGIKNQEAVEQAEYLENTLADLVSLLGSPVPRDMRPPTAVLGSAGAAAPVP